MKEPEQGSAQVCVAAFENLRMADVEPVGGKNASLGEMISQLAVAGVSSLASTLVLSACSRLPSS